MKCFDVILPILFYGPFYSFSGGLIQVKTPCCYFNKCRTRFWLFLKALQQHGTLSKVITWSIACKMWRMFWQAHADNARSALGGGKFYYNSGDNFLQTNDAKPAKEKQERARPQWAQFKLFSNIVFWSISKNRQNFRFSALTLEKEWLPHFLADGWSRVNRKTHQEQNIRPETATW